MGLEFTAHARLNDARKGTQQGDASIHLDTDVLVVRGEVAVRIPRTSIAGATASRGVVTVAYANGTLALEVGENADKVATQLAAPLKTRLEKLGIKSGSVVTILNIDDAHFADEVHVIGASIETRLKKNAALIVLGVNVAKDLAHIETASRSMADNGALWVVHPKGVVGVKDTDIFSVGIQAGLVSTKVARFSETHTAEKLVVPLASRAR